MNSAIANDPAIASLRAELEQRLLHWYIHSSDVVPYERQSRRFEPGVPRPST